MQVVLSLGSVAMMERSGGGDAFPEWDAEAGIGERGLLPRSVAEHLRSLILQGGLKPGDRLPSQRALAERLGVSRPSLREAISALETMGLVRVRVGSGVYVAPPSVRPPLWKFAERCSAREVYEARYGLEGYAARLAAQRASLADARRLDDAISVMRKALTIEDIAGMAKADAAFHDAVFALAGNAVLIGMYQPVRDLMVETQRLPMTLRVRLQDTLKEHEVVGARIVAGDTRGAETAMKRHIRAAAARYGLQW